MRVLFATGSISWPFVFDGGSQRAQHELLTRLIARGGEVLSLCMVEPHFQPRALDNARIAGCTVRTIEPGVPVEGVGVMPGQTTAMLHTCDAGGVTLAASSADYSAACSHLLEAFKPDLVVTWLWLAEHVLHLAGRSPVPVLLRLFDPSNPRGYPRQLSERTTVIANAPVTAQAASRFYQRAVPFMIEPVDHQQYRVAGAPCDAAERPCVTFVNPSWPKGLGLVVEIARRLPQVPFQIVRGWSWTSSGPDTKAAQSVLASMPHVQFIGPLPDMREAYGRTRLLLAPSRWPEAWGRVVSEAQASGIPVIASDRGSMPLNVGCGGVILPYGDPQLWAQLIDYLYHTPQVHADLSRHAAANVRRFPYDQLTDRYVDAIADLAAGRSPRLLSPVEPVTIQTVRRDGHDRPLIKPRVIHWDDPVDLSEPSHL